jgi:cytoskeletal protein CcmA (bactofilin family)
MWNKPSETKPSSQGSAAPVASKSDVQTDIKPEPKSEVSVQPAVAPATAVATPHPASAVGNAAPVTAPIRNSAPAPSAPTTIGTGLNIKGEVTGSSDLFIDGEAQGKIVLSDSKVTIGANGRVTADIDGREIIVEGTVQGNLKASDGVHLSASSIVKGTILTPRITIKDGADLSAKVEMVRADETRAASSSSSGGSSSAADSESHRALAARAEGA